MDLTELARIVSSIIFASVDKGFYNGAVINADVSQGISLPVRFRETNRLRSCGRGGDFKVADAVNDEPFRCMAGVADNIDRSLPEYTNLGS